MVERDLVVKLQVDYRHGDEAKSVHAGVGDARVRETLHERRGQWLAGAVVPPESRQESRLPNPVLEHLMDSRVE